MARKFFIPPLFPCSGDSKNHLWHTAQPTNLFSEKPFFAFKLSLLFQRSNVCVFYVPFLPLLPSRLARFSCVLPFLLRKEYFFYFTVVLGNQREFSFFSSPRLKTCFGIFFSSSFFVGCQSNVPRLEECQCGGYRKRLLIPRLRVGENVYCSKYKNPPPILSPHAARNEA